jgi:ferredoxin-NADP reductase
MDIPEVSAYICMLKLWESIMNSLTQQGWTWFSQALTQHSSFSGYFQPLIQMFVPQWVTDAYRAQIIEIRDEMADMYTLVLKPKTGLIDRTWPEFQAGQYGSRTLRCFSISSSPAYYKKTGLIELSIRIQQQGRITPWIRQQLAPGHLVNISVAQGEFILPKLALTKDERPKKYLFIAGGSGITPFRSMLQQQALQQKALNKQSIELDIHLLYYSRDDQHIVFQRELEQLQKEYPSIQVTFVNGEKEGFICREHLQDYCPDYDLRTSYICGPTPMIQQARKVLDELDVAEEKVNFEFFGAAPVELKNNEHAVVHFQVSQKTVVSEKDEINTLLEQAESQGLTPVSGCRIGVCHQCICKKKSGIVFNTRTQTYSDTGSEEIQLCISVAQGDVVLDL